MVPGWNPSISSPSTVIVLKLPFVLLATSNVIVYVFLACVVSSGVTSIVTEEVVLGLIPVKLAGFVTTVACSSALV